MVQKKLKIMATKLVKKPCEVIYKQKSQHKQKKIVAKLVGKRLWKSEQVPLYRHYREKNIHVPLLTRSPTHTIVGIRSKDCATVSTKERNSIAHVKAKYDPFRLKNATHSRKSRQKMTCPSPPYFSSNFRT